MITEELGKVSVVPKGEWSSSTAYSILDIVSNGGSSYMAKKAVPAGTALSNTEYWMQLVSAGIPVVNISTSQVNTSDLPQFEQYAALTDEQAEYFADANASTICVKFTLSNVPYEVYTASRFYDSNGYTTFIFFTLNNESGYDYPSMKDKRFVVGWYKSSNKRLYIKQTVLVTDVKVNGTSVTTNGVANITAGGGATVEFDVDLTTQMRNATSEESALGYVKVVENLTTAQKAIIENTSNSTLVMTTPLESGGTAYPYIVMMRLPYYTTCIRFIVMGYGYGTTLFDYDSTNSKLMMMSIS